MAISVKGKLADKVSTLLGGKNITERRVESLLEELEALRNENNALREREAIPTTGTGMQEAAARHIDTAMTAINLGVEAATLRMRPISTVPVGTPVLAGETPKAPLGGQAVPHLLEDDFNVEELEEDDEPAEVEAPAPSLPNVLTLPPGLSPTEKFMMEMLQKLAGDIADLKKPSEEKQRSQAVMDGKLPPPSMIQPLVGLAFKKYSDIPRGQWVKSPFGPSVNIRLCNCNSCSYVKELHYYCVICQGGPHGLQGGGRPHYVQGHFAPGSSWGVNHYCCSEPCFQRYQSIIGVKAGFQPTGAEPELDRPGSMLSD